MEQEGTRFYGLCLRHAPKTGCSGAAGSPAPLNGIQLELGGLTGGKKERRGATEDTIRDRQHQPTSLANQAEQEKPESSAPARPSGGHPCKRDDTVVLQRQPNVQPQESRHTANSSGHDTG